MRGVADRRSVLRGHRVAGVLGRGRGRCSVRDRAADHCRLFIAAQMAGDDLAAATAAEALDQRADIINVQRRLVVVDGDGLRDGVRLDPFDASLAPQELLERSGAAGAEETAGFKDSFGHDLLHS